MSEICIISGNAELKNSFKLMGKKYDYREGS